MIRLVAVGDVFLGEHYFNLGHGIRSTLKSTHLSNLLSDFRQSFDRADLVFCNLECPLSDTGLDEKDFESAAFRGLTSSAASLADVGFNLVSVANNHILQHGVEAATQTVEMLEQNGIAVVGLKSTDPTWHSRPFYLSNQGLTICVLAYSDVPEQHCPGQSSYAHWDENLVRSDIEHAKKESDVCIVSLHSGVEGSTTPTERERAMHTLLADLGVCLVIGHHTHVVQPFYKKKDTLILSDTGNFLFDLLWSPIFRRGCAAVVDITAYGADLADVMMTRQLGYKDDFRVRAMNAQHNHQRSLKENTEMEFQPITGWKLQLRKLFYFLRNLFRGNVRLKSKFLIHKLLNLVNVTR